MQVEYNYVITFVSMYVLHMYIGKVILKTEVMVVFFYHMFYTLFGYTQLAFGMIMLL